MRQVCVQYDPNGDGTFSYVVSDQIPIVDPPIMQLIFPEGTPTIGMILDLTQDPPILIPRS